MQADLHIHTTYSDGLDPPEKIVSLAKSAGLGAIAITDHDTLDGIIPAVKAGKEQNLEVIPGIEVSSEYGGEEIHILGYLIRLNHEELLDKLSLFRENRIDRIKKMIQKLRNLGFEVDLNRVLQISGSGSLGRPHLAAALLETGAVKSTAEAFNLYIGAGRPAYVPRYKLTPAEAIQLIHSAGGVPVLAHPGLNRSLQLLGELKAAGLAGLEAYHPAHTREQAACLVRLAEANDLIVTGGSDYHGPGHPAGCRLGSDTVPCSVVADLKKKARSPKEI
ncbi:MAG TPA: PHP domain-containing protein [Bacillota bacterium]|nr:PHP domain-containing protein [Bacillota bacterium]HQD75097.1 PHP domain-containing protein [Bacillota bacterium]HUM57654.1 PHP domain-containing protein [Bacillota bacterium]